MKYFFLKVFLLIFLNSAFSQIEDYYIGENIKEKVKANRIKEIQGEMFKYAAGIIEPEGKLVFLFAFDEKGCLAKKRIYSQKKEKTTASYDYFYNSNDVLTEDVEFDGTGKVSLKCKYKYDEKGRLAEREKYKPNGKISSTVLFKYDETNGTYTEEWYNNKGSVYEEKKFSFDERGNIIEEIHFNNEFEIVTHYVYKYNDRNAITEKINFYADGNIYEKWIYEYNSDGSRINEYHYFTGEKPEYSLKFVYDENSLIKEFNYYIESGKVCKTFKYNYTFY